MSSRLRSGAVFLSVVTLAVIARAVVGHPLWVRTRAMVPSVLSSELVWISGGLPVIGDVVQVELDDEPGLYRLIAIEGQTVEITNGALLVDGQQVEGKRLQSIASVGASCRQQTVTVVDAQVGGHRFQVVPGGSMAPQKIQAGRVFLLGDHRGVAGDSRPWGAVEYGQLKGVAETVLWSWEPCRSAPRWHRIGKSIE